MLRQFQPFIDYKKMIELQANQGCYRLSKEEIKGNKYNSPVIKKVKVRKLGKK